MSRRRRILLGVAVGLVLLVAAGAGVAWWAVHRTVADVHNGASLPFTPSSSTPLTTTPTSSTGGTQGPNWGPDWPFYGRNEARTRDATDITTVKPPYAVAWKLEQGALIEFPPSYHRGVLYLGRDDGWVLAIGVKKGRVLWQHRFGPVPNQPAYWQGLVFFGTFDKPGSVYALKATNGHVVWRAKLSDQVESSMVVSDGKV